MRRMFHRLRSFQNSDLSLVVNHDLKFRAMNMKRLVDYIFNVFVYTIKEGASHCNEWRRASQCERDSVRLDLHRAGIWARTSS